MKNLVDLLNDLSEWLPASEDGQTWRLHPAVEAALASKIKGETE